MSASVIGSNSRRSRISQTEPKKAAPKERVANVFSGSDASSSVNTKLHAKKDEKFSNNTFFVRTADCKEDSGSWTNITGCGGPRWRSREAIFKVISDLAHEIAKRDGEIETMRERAAHQDKLIRDFLYFYRSLLQQRYAIMKAAKRLMTASSSQEINLIVSEMLSLFKEQEEDGFFRQYFGKELDHLSYYTVFPAERELSKTMKNRTNDLEPISNGSSSDRKRSFHKPQRQGSFENVASKCNASMHRVDSDSAQLNGFMKKTSNTFYLQQDGAAQKCSEAEIKNQSRTSFVKSVSSVDLDDENFKLKNSLAHQNAKTADFNPFIATSSSNIVGQRNKNSKSLVGTSCSLAKIANNVVGHQAVTTNVFPKQKTLAGVNCNGRVVYQKNIEKLTTSTKINCCDKKSQLAAANPSIRCKRLDKFADDVVPRKALRSNSEEVITLSSDEEK